jgi:hypothetical protein
MREVAVALEEEDLSRAMIAALQLGLGEISDESIARLTLADSLSKYNFNPLQPRDRQGRWGGDSTAGVRPARAGGPPRRDPASGGRAWERSPNPEFRERLAIAEGSANKPEYGYNEVRQSTGALGRYQMTPDALRAAGMIDASANWTGKYGIHSRTQFLADHKAQEKALTDYLRDTERQLRANGGLAYIGSNIDGRLASFSVTRAGLIAAGHTGKGLRRLFATFNAWPAMDLPAAASLSTRASRRSKHAFEPSRMRRMNSRSSYAALAFGIAICQSPALASATDATPLHWSKTLSSDERGCLDELIKISDLADPGIEQFHKLTAAARVSRTSLNGGGRKEYVFLFDDIGWCGSAGCALVIGEPRADSSCRLLYSGSGWYTATVLRQRDHGYHRLYLPCEVRFDGHQYQQLREECPNANVIH